MKQRSWKIGKSTWIIYTGKSMYWGLSEPWTVRYFGLGPISIGWID